MFCVGKNIIQNNMLDKFQGADHMFQKKKRKGCAKVKIPILLLVI